MENWQAWSASDELQLIRTSRRERRMPMAGYGIRRMKGPVQCLPSYFSLSRACHCGPTLTMIILTIPVSYSHLDRRSFQVLGSGTSLPGDGNIDQLPNILLFHHLASAQCPTLTTSQICIIIIILCQHGIIDHDFLGNKQQHLMSETQKKNQACERSTTIWPICSILFISSQGDMEVIHPPTALLTLWCCSNRLDTESVMETHGHRRWTREEPVNKFTWVRLPGGDRPRSVSTWRYPSVKIFSVFWPVKTIR